MGANSEKKVLVGSPKVGGAIFRAPTGSALPVTARAALNVAFINQGYATPDGLKRAIKKAYAAMNAWGGDEMAKSRTELSVSMTFNLAQVLDADVNKTVMGEDSVTLTAATSTHGNLVDVAFDGEELPRSSWVFDIAFNGRLRRIVIPEGQITTEEQSEDFKDDAAVGYPVTITCYRDSAGKFFYDYNDDGELAS